MFVTTIAPLLPETQVIRSLLQLRITRYSVSRSVYQGNFSNREEIAMTSLVTGSTGAIGSRVVANLAAKGADVHALARSPEKAQFPSGVLP